MTIWKKSSSRWQRRRGGALLAVLWLSAALSAIAYSLANTVRGEIERTSTEVDGLRSYYLARAGIDRAILYMQWGDATPLNAPFKYKRGTPLLPFSFPSGRALVEVIPETAKLNINSAPPLELVRRYRRLANPLCSHAV
jgi:general secretion pathway protein K